MVGNREIEDSADSGERQQRGEQRAERALVARHEAVVCYCAALAVLQFVQTSWQVVLRPRTLIYAWREPVTIIIKKDN